MVLILLTVNKINAKKKEKNQTKHFKEATSKSFPNNQNENISVKFLLFTNILVLKKTSFYRQPHFFLLCLELLVPSEQFNELSKIKLDYRLYQLLSLSCSPMTSTSCLGAVSIYFCNISLPEIKSRVCCVNASPELRLLSYSSVLIRCENTKLDTFYKP